MDNNQKKYSVYMDDGEYCMSGTLEECKAYREKHWHSYISRYHILRDSEYRKCSWITGEPS